jgi:hypothetical protein
MNKWFSHWSRRVGMADAVLLKAAREIAAGQAEADLGGGLFKKRLPRQGGGKSGGFRVLVGYKKPNADRIIFLYAFAKSDKANISDREKSALSFAAESFVSATDERIAALLSTNVIWEVPIDE